MAVTMVETAAVTTVVVMDGIVPVVASWVVIMAATTMVITATMEETMVTPDGMAPVVVSWEPMIMTVTAVAICGMEPVVVLLEAEMEATEVTMLIPICSVVPRVVLLLLITVPQTITVRVQDSGNQCLMKFVLEACPNPSSKSFFLSISHPQSPQMLNWVWADFGNGFVL